MCVCLCERVHVPQHRCEGQRTTLGVSFLFPARGAGVKLRAPGWKQAPVPTDVRYLSGLTCFLRNTLEVRGCFKYRNVYYSQLHHQNSILRKHKLKKKNQDFFLSPYNSLKVGLCHHLSENILCLYSCVPKCLKTQTL